MEKITAELSPSQTNSGIHPNAAVGTSGTAPVGGVRHRSGAYLSDGNQCSRSVKTGTSIMHAAALPQTMAPLMPVRKPIREAGKNMLNRRENRKCQRQIE